MENLEMEIWRPVVGYHGYESIYEISSHGRVRSVKYQRCLNPFTTTNGYLSVELNHKGKPKKATIHRLIALAFLSNVESKPHVNHINGIKKDNRIENLEWCTSQENRLHAIKIGLAVKKGEKKRIRRLSVKQARYLITSPNMRPTMVCSISDFRFEKGTTIYDLFEYTYTEDGISWCLIASKNPETW